jgi:hypothetical protein
MPANARTAASRLQNSRGFRAAARAGYVANGVLHVLIGTLILAVVIGAGGGQTDQTGAFRAVAEAPGGTAFLWLLAVALWALALWHAVQAFFAPGEGTDRVKNVAKHAGQAVVFAAVGGIGASVALGGGGGGDQGPQEASGGVLALPGGPFLLGAAGLVVVGIGVFFVVRGVTRRFRKKITPPAGAAGKGLVALGVVGYVAKGIALATIGVLLVVAAVRVDPSEAGGLDGAVSALLATPAGPLLGVLVGAGFIAYGVFEASRAKYGTLS